MGCTIRQVYRPCVGIVRIITVFSGVSKQDDMLSSRVYSRGAHILHMTLHRMPMLALQASAFIQ